MEGRSYAVEICNSEKNMDGLWRGEKKKREGSYLHTHEEVLGSGESRDKHVTTPTPMGIRKFGGLRGL